MSLRKLNLKKTINSLVTSLFILLFSPKLNVDLKTRKKNLIYKRYNGRLTLLKMWNLHYHFLLARTDAHIVATNWLTAFNEITNSILIDTDVDCTKSFAFITVIWLAWFFLCQCNLSADDIFSCLWKMTWSCLTL